jgi:hypothetical protein
VYWNGKKVSFGDASMPNRNNNDKARANFNSRHNCSEKKDKSKVRTKTQMHAHVLTLGCLLSPFALCAQAGYWACKVWRKGGGK